MAASKTVDNGSSWTRYNFGTGTGYAYVITMQPFNSNTLYVGGYENNQPAIFRTTDSGASWSKLSGAGLTGYVYALAIEPVPPYVMYAGTGTSLFKSTDGGNTWSATGFPGGHTKSIVMVDVPVLRAGLILAATNNNGIYKSWDNGQTWIQDNGGLLDLNINCLKVSPAHYIYAGSVGSSAYRQQVPGSIEEGQNRPTPKNGLSVAPNPACGPAQISYFVAAAGQVGINIYSTDGRLVRTLINKELDPGSYQVRWDGRDSSAKKVPAGVYFCKFLTGDETNVAKVVLLK